MAWQRIFTIPTTTVASTGLNRSGFWFLRGLYHVFAWRENTAEIAWACEFPDEVLGEELLVSTDDVVIVASFQRATFHTDFVAIEIKSGEVRWRSSQPFRPANRRNTKSMSCDGSCVTCLGSNIDRQFCMLRLDLASGELVGKSVFDVRHDVTLDLEGRTFVGGSRGLFVLQDDRLEPVLGEELIELEYFGSDLIASTRDSANCYLTWLTASGELKARLALGRSLGILHPTSASSPGLVLVMPQLQPGLSLYDLHSGQVIWAVGEREELIGHRAIFQEGRLLAHVERGRSESAIVALEEATGSMIESPVDRVRSIQLFGANGRFLLSFLQRLDVYRWI